MHEEINMNARDFTKNLKPVTQLLTKTLKIHQIKEKKFKAGEI